MSVCAILPNPYAHGLKNPALSSVQFCISPWNGYSRSHFKVKYTETELRPGAKELATEIRLRPLSFIVDPQALQALFNIINWVEHIDRQIYEVSWTAPNAAGQYSVIFTSKNKEPTSNSRNLCESLLKVLTPTLSTTTLPRCLRF